MTDLRELEKRLEEATGPSKELDDAVFRACGLKVYPYDEPSGTTWGAAYPVTKSLDAAVALVERCLNGWGWRCGQGVTKHWVNGRAVTGWAFLNRVHPDHADDQKDEAVAYSETAPLALCLALIRALIAKGDRHD